MRKNKQTQNMTLSKHLVDAKCVNSYFWQLLNLPQHFQSHRRGSYKRSFVYLEIETKKKKVSSKHLIK